MHATAPRLASLFALACAVGAIGLPARAQSTEEPAPPRERHERREARDREKHHAGPAAGSPQVRWLLTMHGSDGKPQAIWGLRDTGELVGPLNTPIPDGPAGPVPHDLRGIAPLPDGGFLAMNAYIKDTRILRFGAPNADGTFPYLGDFAKHGDANPALLHGYQIAVARDGTVYTSNQDTDTVTRFAGVAQPNAGAPISPDGATGDAIGVMVRSDKTSAEGVRDIRGIAFGPDGLLYVCDRGAGCVSAYDTTTGRRVRAVAESKHGLQRPIQALVTADGAAMFVGDNGADCVFKVELASGRVSNFIAKGTAGLKEPSALAIDGDWLYVGSREGRQILRFRLADGAPDAKPFATLPDNPEFLVRLP